MDGKAFELAVIGAGNMAEAIVRGVLSAGLIPAERIIAADPVAARRSLFTDQLKIKSVEAPTANARIVLLSVKPQQMNGVLGALERGSDALFISIAAGVRTATIESVLSESRVVRAMPNTPMLVGEGMTAICRGSKATADDLATARRLFESAGRVIEVEESQMEAVTAVSGSGPAYVFYLAEQMMAAGASLGLSAEQAKTLTLQTIAGAARMLVSSSDTPIELRRKVTSPGGTTQAAIESMEASGVGVGIQKAVIAAAERGKVLGG